MTAAEAIERGRREAVACPFIHVLDPVCPLDPYGMRLGWHLDAHLAASVAAWAREVAAEAWAASGIHGDWYMTPSEDPEPETLVACIARLVGEAT